MEQADPKWVRNARKLWRDVKNKSFYVQRGMLAEGEAFETMEGAGVEGVIRSKYFEYLSGL
jgi:hypothetical protein